MATATELRSLTKLDDIEDGSGPDAAPARRGRRRVAAVALVAAGAALFAASLRGSASRGALAPAGAAVSLEAVKTNATAVPCAADGEACGSAKCCEDGGAKGLQCYAKNDFWAQCLESCEKGVHPKETRGTWDAQGKFHPEEWSCALLGNRSKPACTTYASKGACPSDRCMWKGSKCLTPCDTITCAEACGKADQCMWKGKCMEACGSFDSQATCKPFDKCLWRGDKCLEGCWTFGADTCAKDERCRMVGGTCKDECWTMAEGECGKHGRCMWRSGKCSMACNQFATKESCPADLGCMFAAPEGGGAVACRPDPCGTPGEDCTQSKCCSSQRGASGMTCFAKNQYYATCLPSCGEKDWSCKALGNRSKYEPGCAWAGASCSAERLCCNVGFNCLVKDDIFTGCVQTVKKTTWTSQIVPLPAGWKGTFVGAGRTEYEVPAQPAGQPVATSALYCIMAVLPDSSEVQLMKLAKQNKASVFACDDHDIFHSWQSAKSGWDTGEATLTNTDVFINVWDQVRDAGKYELYDWTAKVDADAVLVPARLKQHIDALRAPPGRAIYIKNNDMDKGLGNNGFLGAVEVFSKTALYVYYDNKEGCRATLGIQAGEDGFFKGCMDALGVGYMMDAHLFFPDRSAGVCNLQQRAAYHPLKKPEDWQCCMDIINGKPHKVEYGTCDLGYTLKIEG